MLHGEHAWLFESILLHVVLVLGFLAFKFAELRHGQVITINFLIFSRCVVVEEKVCPIKQCVLRLLLELFLLAYLVVLYALDLTL